MDNSLTTLLSTLSTSLESAVTALPDETAILPPKDGISLLDVKNELLLSYLQHLVFLILLKIRGRSRHSVQTNGTEEGDSAEGGADPAQDDAVKKLVELRLYMEKGVRPLEGRLKYQIDKVVRAAEDAARLTAQKTANEQAQQAARQSQRDISDDESDGDRASSPEVDELAYRPNPASFVRPAVSAAKRAEAPEKDGIYRPPRITATAMPTTRDREEKGDRRMQKSATLDEFIATELSTAPVAEPSIGSTIVAGGRRTKSQKEREQEEERRAYEESNFVRLPKESKKDRAKKGGRRDGYGGEEWRDLGIGLDRIDRLTQKKGGSTGVLERSRKRPVEDGPRGDGAGVGEHFEKRRKMHVTKGRRR